MKILVVLFILAINATFMDYCKSNCVFGATNRMNSSKIATLETMNFGRSFDYDSTSTRLKRLEERFFGAVQNGSNSQRIKRLENYSNGGFYDNYYGYNRPYYRNGISPRVRRGLRNLSKIFYDGSLTGVTPPVQYNPIYMGNNGLNSNDFDINTYGEEREYCDSYGNCTTDYTNRGSNMGVKIIY